MSKFWIQFAVTEAIGLAQSYVATSGLNDALKAALAAFIDAGKGVLAALHLA